MAERIRIAIAPWVLLVALSCEKPCAPEGTESVRNWTECGLWTLRYDIVLEMPVSECAYWVTRPEAVVCRSGKWVSR